MGPVPVKPHQQVAERTQELESAFYALLDALDRYRETVDSLLDAEQASPQPREQLVHRLRQLSGWSARIGQIMEEEALTLLLPILDRLFALERAEVGTDI